MAFVVFEGAEGVGKSTQIRLLCEWLAERGVAAVATREPGGTPFADEIRELFKKVPAHADHPTALTELMLVMAARAQHVETKIRPWLAEGRCVVCDRFMDSTYVYQGQLRGIARRYIDTVAAGVLGGLVPDLTFILTTSHQEARRRMQERGNTAGDRLDSMGDDALLALADGFAALAASEVPYPCGRVPLRVVVPANGSPEEIHRTIRAHAATLLGVQP